jgi:CubicO group peptidase (beta-lactamase class C family)
MTIEINHEKCDIFLEKALFYYDLPGLAVSIGIAGEVYSKVLGYQDALAKKPLEKHHIFHMASVSKLFVGTSILQLWERGLLELDEKLSYYLPWFEMADLRYQRISVRQLLSHTSGMPDVSDYHWESPETDDLALKRYVQSDEVKCAHLLWAPEEAKFCYSNMGYEILGVLISTVSGLSFEDYVQRNIFDLLGMKASTFMTFQRDMSEVCSPHIKTDDNMTVFAPHFPYNRAHAPSSTLTSNLGDLEKWAFANLNQTLLKPTTYHSAWAKQALVPNNGEHICLSWFHRKQKEHVLYGHEGNDDGFRSSFWISPELDLFIIVCSNLSGAPVKKINKQLFDLVTE